MITPHLGAFKDKPWAPKNKEWAAMMVHLDRGVGRMTELLAELGLENNTIIFFAGDNGYSQWGYFGRKRYDDDPLFRNKGPWRGGKFIVREGGVRVPFFAFWPGRITPRESALPCALYDFLATAADLAGVPIKHAQDGISLVPELANQPDRQQEHAYLYWENGSFAPHAQAVRIGSWRAYREHPSKPTELYQIEKDVASERDVAGDHPEIIQKIEAIFVEARTESLWYVNPGESQEVLAKKRQQAKEAGKLQVPVKANTTYSRPGSAR